VLDPGEVILLRELCRSLDRIDTLEDEIAEHGLIVRGTRGQLPKSTPLLYELREETKSVSRLVSELALPVPGEAFGLRRHPAQRRAAKTHYRGRA
jgi:hypothetical protein